MCSNAFIPVLVCVVACATVYAYPPIYTDESHAVNDNGGNDGGGYAMPQFNLANAHSQQQHRVRNNKPMDASKISTSQSPAAEAISATMAVSPPSLQSAYVYSAQVPANIQPEANKVVNAVKLTSSTAAAMPAALSPSTQNDFTDTYQSTGPSENGEMYIDWSKRTIGSSAPSSVAVVLNGNEPEYTDALGQKVPKPLPSLQVASPIDLLNPDRYEFFTFDENGELVKRLMTMEEIQSIVANGDGEGPTIIHHGPVEDRDPEKNVQDIVNSVQDVLNKEVESNKNSSSNILPVLDTPDVSSSWSMILPAIFGNTGGVDIFTHQKPQQIVMTPDTEIIETSTKAPKTTTTKKPKPNKRKPGLKRKPSATTSTTEVTPQVIQEELESHESVYTGMQQYQHLAATMENYDGFSQLHMQPIYHKLPEQMQVEATTKRIFMNNQEVAQKPSSDDSSPTENQGKKPVSVQHKPPHRVKNPNGGSTTTKRPQSTKQKINKKSTTTTTTKPEATTSFEVIPSTPTTSTTSTTTQAPTTTTEAIAITTSTETAPVVATPAPSTEATSQSTTTNSTSPTLAKKKKKKPTRQPIHTTSAQSDGSSTKPHPTADHRKPSPKPHRPRPTLKPQVTTTDLTAAGSAHQEVSHNKYQHVTYHRTRPKPQKPTTSPVPSTTVVIAPVPVSTVPTPQEPTLIVESFPGYLPSNTVSWDKITTVKPTLPTTTPKVVTNTGTAGYPVPAYAITTGKYEEYENQYKKQPLTNSPITHHTVTKPYQDQDIHAMQSFDQILQSLKQPDISAGKIDHAIVDSVPPQVNPVKYDSAENMDQLEEMANKHMVPVINSMTEGPTTNLPLYTHHGSNTLSTTVADLESTTDSSSVVPEESTVLLENATKFVVTTEQPEPQGTTTIPWVDTTINLNLGETKEIETFNYTAPVSFIKTSTTSTAIPEISTQHPEEDTETSIDDGTTEAPDSPEESVYSTEPQIVTQETTSNRLSNQTTLIYADEITTDSSDTLEDTTQHLKIQTRLPVKSPHNKDTVMDDDRDNYNQPILVADLKPQLNMEVLKPSEQISMSDFQTQAATVASTLVDGTNTLAVDYNTLSSNETKDEIAFLMSDVIKQISNDNTIPNSGQANYSEKPSSSSSDQTLPQIVQMAYNDESNDELGSNPVQASFSGNRYSNIAKLNATFLSVPQGQNNLLPFYGGGGVVEENTPTNVRYEDNSIMDTTTKDDHISVETTTLASETTSTLVVVDMTGEATTELPDAIGDLEKVNSIEGSSSVEDFVTTTFSEREELTSYENTTPISETLDSVTINYAFELQKDDSDESSNMSTTESVELKSDTIENLNESDEKATTLKSPVLSFSEIITEEQANNDDREALFESDNSVDTTTQIISLSEETTDSQWKTVSDGGMGTESSDTVINTTVDSTVTYVTKTSMSETEMQEPTDKSLTSEDIENTTVLSRISSEEDKLHLSETETSTATVESTAGLGDITSSVTQEDATLRYGSSTSNSSDPYPEDSESNATVLEPQSHTEIDTEENINEVSTEYTTTESIEVSTQDNKTESPQKDEEVTTFPNSLNENEDIENTTLNFQMSEETSEELSAMISEEDETEELVDEDPYIKLGETTTTKYLESATASSPEITKLKLESAENEMQAVTPSEQKIKKPQAVAEPVKQSDEQMVAPPNPISIKVVPEIATDAGAILPPEDSEQSFEGADEEDEDDQIGYQTSKLPDTSSTSTTSASTTTTLKPTVTTTRRLNTLKPVSYFNKQPAYALFQDAVEPLYNKPPFQGQPQQENMPNKVYSIATPQQRPMQRPPQLSNLMIASTQATRPPVKLEPSPTHSKGLEASLANLDEDILSFARLCNELAFSYWKSITSEKISSTRSLVLSPFALTSMLSMVFLGARGSTSGEMNDVLRLDDMVTFNPHLVFKNITDSVEKAMDSDIATTAFVREVFSDRANGKILQFFKEKTQQLYSGHVEEVNFHVVNDIIRRRTNLLVKRHTMGKVLEYLRTNSVWVNGPLATISANLFQTDCSQGSTHERDGEIFFQVHPTVRQRRLVPIPAVLFKSGFTAGYEPNLETTVVAFGRIQDTTSLIYVMPGHHSSFSPSDNLDRLEKELMETAISKNAWSNLLTSLMDRPGMEVQLPRFSHRSFVNATLGLQKMGLKGLFKSDFADLGGLTGSSNRDIYLSDMIQINTFSTCGEEKIADHHHVEMYPAPPLRKRNKDVDAHQDDDFDSSEAIIDFGSLVQDSALGRGFYDDLLDPKYLELPLPLRPRQARVPDSPRLRFDKPFLYFVRHNPTGMILFMGRFNPRLLP